MTELTFEKLRGMTDKQLREKFQKHSKDANWDCVNCEDPEYCCEDCVWREDCVCPQQSALLRQLKGA